jgi:hypothetical protein
LDELSDTEIVTIGTMPPLPPPHPIIASAARTTIAQPRRLNLPITLSRETPGTLGHTGTNFIWFESL